ncbi:MAG TPA: hypothetical protein VFZ73_06965 [Gemmatimonadaceae bacterium]
MGDVIQNLAGRGPTSRTALTCVLAFLLSVTVTHVQAQISAPQRRVHPEFRIDVVTGDVSSAHLGGGVHIRSGTYFQIAVLAGAGLAWKDDVQRNSYRVEAQGRFHLDPFRASRFGLYGIGGVATSHDPFIHWQSRLVVGAGVELPAHGRGTLAVEATLAGGFRVSVAARRLPLGRR